MKITLNIINNAVVSTTVGSETSTLPEPINKVAFIASMPKPFIRIQAAGDVDGTTETYENFKLGVSSVVTPGDFQASQAAQDVKIAQLQAQGKFRGSFPTTAARDAAITTPAEGDYVTIGTASPYQITIYQGTAWVNGGTTTGPFDFTVVDLTAATSEDAIFTSAIVGKWYTIKTQEGSVRLVQCYNKLPTYAEFWGEGYAQIIDFSATQGVNTLPMAKYSNVVVSQTPTDPGHATAKIYVDAAVYDGVRITNGTVGEALTKIKTAIGKGYNVTLITPTNNRALFVDEGVAYTGVITPINLPGMGTQLTLIANPQTSTALSNTTYVLIGKEK